MRCHSNSNATHHPFFIHPPKTGGHHWIHVPAAPRLYQAIVHPRRPSTVDYCGGYKVLQNWRSGGLAYACCLWMMSSRAGARLKSAFSTSQEDQQHFDCPRGTWTHKRLRKKDKPPLTLERFAALPAAERRKCDLNVYLDQLAPQPGSIKSRLKHAKKRVESLPLVALTEQFDRSLRLLDATLGLQLQAFTTVHTYNPRGDRSLTNLTARAEKALRRDIRPDLILWRTAVKRFEQLWTVQFGESDEKNGKSANAFRCEVSQALLGQAADEPPRSKQEDCGVGAVGARRTSRAPAARAEGRDVAGRRG